MPHDIRNVLHFNKTKHAKVGMGTSIARGKLCAAPGRRMRAYRTVVQGIWSLKAHAYQAGVEWLLMKAQCAMTCRVVTP